MATDYLDLPIIVAGDRLTLGNGLYRLRGRVRTDRYYNALTDTWEDNVEQVLMVRVDDGTELPGGCEAMLRLDGKRVITCWAPRYE